MQSHFERRISLVEILGEGKKSNNEDNDDDEDEDVLINVNIADNELAKKRVDLSKKKTPGYRAYDDTETADQFGMVRLLHIRCRSWLGHLSSV